MNLFSLVLAGLANAGTFSALQVSFDFGYSPASTKEEIHDAASVLVEPVHPKRSYTI